MLERHAEKARAPLHVAGQHWHAHVENGRLVYQDEQGLLDLPPPKLFGRHQFDNAGTAIAALRAAGIRLPVTAIEQGLMRAEWPARLQRLTDRQAGCARARRRASCGSTAGTTRRAGARSRRRSATWRSACRARWCWSSACSATKDRSAFLRNFTGLVRRVFGVPIHQDKGVPVDEIAAAAHAAGMPADASESIEEALAAIGRLGFDPPPRILITGSLYLAGEVLAANGTRIAVVPDISAKRKWPAFGPAIAQDFRRPESVRPPSTT